MSQMDREECEERTRLKQTGGSSPTARKTLRVILLSMAVPVILSATGPLYYGYTDGPYASSFGHLPALWGFRGSSDHRSRAP
jgi:hypothetical protein